LGPLFKGIYPKTLFSHVKIKKNGKFVIVKTIEGYTTDLPLSFMMSENALLTYAANGNLLDLEHGFPLRLVTNGKYAYKDAKWVSELEITDKDFPGYWEERGYSKSADIHKEERFEK
jgi:DMSO/TMAO reductase YedYZ molybdopterin-dependent catalytic subunit